MGPIFATLVNSVLPVSVIFMIGFFVGRRGVFTPPDAAALFKFIAQIAAPAIIVSIVITTDITDIDLILAGLYIASELVIYGITYGLARRFFGLTVNHALLCGLGAAFANHVLFVYPITLLAFDPIHSVPVRSIITLDILILIGTVVALDINSNRGTRLRTAIIQQWRNPLVLALAIGGAIFAMPMTPPPFFVHSAEFVAKAAAPCGLFATGILLSARPTEGSLKLATMITVMRMVVHPVVGYCLIVGLAGYSFDAARTTLMVTAAPVGVMALTFASRYGVETDAIARAIFWSFLVSIVMIPVIAAL